MKIKQGMILAAGLGKRMLPITLKTPKPLIQIGNKNLLDRAIELLINHGVDEIAINIHHLADQVRSFINKKKYKAKITIFYEQETLLDTGGGILNATKSFKEPFIVVNPDTLWSNAYSNELRDLEDLGKSSSELWSTHPSFLIRMQSLIWFSMTKEYHEFFDSKKKGTYNLAEIDKKLDSKIKKVTGDELEKSNTDIYERALIWGSLDIYLSDKKFSKTEQDEFAKRFGEKAKKAISLLKVSNARDMLDKKIDSSFAEAAQLLKTDKNKLANELKEVGKETGGDKMKKLKIIGKLLNILGIKNLLVFNYNLRARSLGYLNYLLFIRAN